MWHNGSIIGPVSGIIERHVGNCGIAFWGGGGGGGGIIRQGLPGDGSLACHVYIIYVTVYAEIGHLSWS